MNLNNPKSSIIKIILKQLVSRINSQCFLMNFNEGYYSSKKTHHLCKPEKIVGNLYVYQVLIKIKYNVTWFFWQNWYYCIKMGKLSLEIRGLLWMKCSEESAARLWTFFWDLSYFVLSHLVLCFRTLSYIL